MDKKERCMNMDKEIMEAITAADLALESLNEAKKDLSKAAGWGVWDMLGGGLFGTFMKHSRMDDARHAMEMARTRMRGLKSELMDVNLPEDLKLDIGDFLTFADYFFDGIIADWMVQSKINKSSRQVEEAQKRIIQIRDRLRYMRETLPLKEEGGNE